MTSPSPLPGEIEELAYESPGRLARSLLAPDPQTSSVAWRHYAPVVRRIVRRAFPDRADVDDVTQEVFLRLVEQLAMVRAPGSIGSSVSAFALKIVNHEQRRRHNRSWLVLTPTGQFAEDDLVASDEGRLELGGLSRVLVRLTARERHVLLLRYVRGMTLNEISSALSVSLSTAKRAFKRAYRTVGTLRTRHPPVRRLARSL